MLIVRSFLSLLHPLPGRNHQQLQAGGVPLGYQYEIFLKSAKHFGEDHWGTIGQGRSRFVGGGFLQVRTYKD